MGALIPRFAVLGGPECVDFQRDLGGFIASAASHGSAADVLTTKTHLTNGGQTLTPGSTMLNMLSKVRPIWILFGFFSLALLPVIAGAVGWNLDSRIFRISFVVLLFTIWFGWPFSVLVERMRQPMAHIAANEVAIFAISLVSLIVLMTWSQAFSGTPDSLNKIAALLLLFVAGYLSHLFANAWKAEIIPLFRLLIVFFAIYFLPIGAFFLWHISRRERQ